jgi:hypothetical protein
MASSRHVKLTYHNTFIDVTEECVGSAHRSRSLPGRQDSQNSLNIEAEEDLARSGYVKMLMQRSDQLSRLLQLRKQPHRDALKLKEGFSPTAFSPVTSHDLEDMPAVELETSSREVTVNNTSAFPSEWKHVPNPGSFGHPELCRRPCMFFAQSKCATGTMCTFCHLTHSFRPKNLERHHRLQLRRLSEQDRLSLVLPLLRQRAEMTGISASVAEVLEVADKWTDSFPNATVPEHLLKLQKALAKQPFSALLLSALGQPLPQADQPQVFEESNASNSNDMQQAVIRLYAELHAAGSSVSPC